LNYLTGLKPAANYSEAAESVSSGSLVTGLKDDFESKFNLEGGKSLSSEQKTLVINLLWGMNPVTDRLWIDRVVGSVQQGFAVTDGETTIDYDIVANSEKYRSADQGKIKALAQSKPQETLQLIFLVDAHAHMYGTNSAQEARAAADFAADVGVDAGAQAWL